MCKSASALAPEERPVCREDLGGLLRNVRNELSHYLIISFSNYLIITLTNYLIITLTNYHINSLKNSLQYPPIAVSKNDTSFEKSIFYITKDSVFYSFMFW